MTSTPPGDEPRDRAPTDASLYALEKLAQAVDELATGIGNLSRYILRPTDEIPDELRHVLMGLKVDTLKSADDEDAKAIAASASRPFGVRRAFLC
jgi:hypothetical protein